MFPWQQQISILIHFYSVTIKQYQAEYNILKIYMNKFSVKLYGENLFLVDIIYDIQFTCFWI
jgi:hypothetical protein